jgi:hypothetical protein
MGGIIELVAPIPGREMLVFPDSDAAEGFPQVEPVPLLTALLRDI